MLNSAPIFNAFNMSFFAKKKKEEKKGGGGLSHSRRPGSDSHVILGLPKNTYPRYSDFKLKSLILLLHEKYWLLLFIPYATSCRGYDVLTRPSVSQSVLSAQLL